MWSTPAWAAPYLTAAAGYYRMGKINPITYLVLSWKVTHVRCKLKQPWWLMSLQNITMYLCSKWTCTPLACMLFSLWQSELSGDRTAAVWPAGSSCTGAARVLAGIIIPIYCHGLNKLQHFILIVHFFLLSSQFYIVVG